VMSGGCEIGSDNRVWTSRLDRREFQPRNSSGAYQRSVPRRSTRPDVRLSKAGHNALEFQCLLYPRKQTFSSEIDKSALGQKRISAKISCANRKTAAGRSRWSNAFPQCQGTAISLKIP